MLIMDSHEHTNKTSWFHIRTVTCDDVNSIQWIFKAATLKSVTYEELEHRRNVVVEREIRRKMNKEGALFLLFENATQKWRWD